MFRQINICSIHHSKIITEENSGRQALYKIYTIYYIRFFNNRRFPVPMLYPEKIDPFSRKAGKSNFQKFSEILKVF